MGANGDAGSSSIGSARASSGALRAGDPVLSPRGENLALIRDSSCIGNVDLRVHPEQVDPSEIRTILAGVDADDLRSDPAIALGAVSELAQAICPFLPDATASVAVHNLDYPNICRPPVDR